MNNAFLCVSSRDAAVAFYLDTKKCRVYIPADDRGKGLLFSCSEKENVD